MNAQIVLRRTDGAASSEETRLLSFHFVKEAYTPYTTLTAVIDTEEENFLSVCEALFYINDKLVHHGLIDSIEKTETEKGRTVTLASRGFTSQLCQNQLQPGLIENISINSLMDSYYVLPFVTHENSSDSTGYIYVKSSSTMWDGVVNLTYKQNGIYPYIQGTNCVRTTAEQNPHTFTFDDSQLISRGSAGSFRRMISDFHMADISGNYGNCDLTDSEAVNRFIVRNRYLELDRQFLYNPQQALEYRDKFAKRASQRYFCRYSGYSGEDLNDLVSFGEISSKRICKIDIAGDYSGIFTELSVYYDGFYVNGTL